MVNSQGQSFNLMVLQQQQQKKSRIKFWGQEMIDDYR